MRSLEQLPWIVKGQNNLWNRIHTLLTCYLSFLQNEYIGTIKQPIRTNNWEVETYRNKFEMVGLYRQENRDLSWNWNRLVNRHPNKKMPEYNLDWRLKLFFILWIAILLLLTGLSIIRTRKYWIQMRRLEEASKES